VALTVDVGAAAAAEPAHRGSSRVSRHYDFFIRKANYTRLYSAREDHPHRQRRVPRPDHLRAQGRRRPRQRLQPSRPKYHHPLARRRPTAEPMVRWPGVHNTVPHSTWQHIHLPDHLHRRGGHAVVARAQRFQPCHRARRHRYSSQARHRLPLPKAP